MYDCCRTQNQKWKEHCLSLLIPLLQALDSHQLLTRDGEIIPATIPLIVCTAPFGELGGAWLSHTSRVML